MTLAYQLGEILKIFIGTMAWPDQVMGIVKTMRVNVAGNEQAFPAAYNTSRADCDEDTEYISAVPNSKKRNIIYVEDHGTVVTGQDGRYYNMQTRLRVVYWMNYKAMSTDFEDPMNYAAEAIALPVTGPFNVAPFLKLTFELSGFVESDWEIFSNYTYSEAEKQYLTWPYGAFAIEYIAKYSLPRTLCTDPNTLNPARC